MELFLTALEEYLKMLPDFFFKLLPDLNKAVVHNEENARLLESCIFQETGWLLFQ